MTNTNNISAQGISWTVFGAECLQAVFDLRWMIIFAITLIFADMWWGCREMAVKRKQAITRLEREKYKFHFSQVGRRTLNKAVDYLTYLLVGCVAGLAITEPMGLASHTATAAIGLGFGCAFELSSIIGHVCFVKGWNIKINWKKLIVAILKFKWKELADVFEDGIEELDDGRMPSSKSPKQMDDYGQEEEECHHCGEDAFDYEHAEIPQKDFAETTQDDETATEEGC